MGLSTLNSMAFGLAVYASPWLVTSPRRKTHFQLLVRLYLNGILTRKVPMKGFRLHLIPLSQACLAQSMHPLRIQCETECGVGKDRGQ